MHQSNLNQEISNHSCSNNQKNQFVHYKTELCVLPFRNRLKCYYAKITTHQIQVSSMTSNRRIYNNK